MLLMVAGNIRNICIIYNYFRRGLCQKVTIVGDFVVGSVGAVVGASTGGKPTFTGECLSSGNWSDCQIID